jgi:predicted Zn-dependent protease
MAESHESTPTQIFEDAQIRRMLNKDPSVVFQVFYHGAAIPDPMIVPWVRKAVVLKERYDQAIDLLAQQKISEGREALQEIIAEAPNSEYAAQAQGILAKLSDLQAPTQAPEPKKAAVKTPAATPTADDMQLDPNVHVAATMVDPQDAAQSRVMINARSYKQGDVVRNHTNHKVVRIRDDSVTIEVEERGHRKLFDVPVRPQGF